jgi:hypothetical protein
MYGRKIPVVAWLRYGDRWSRGIIPLDASARLPTLLSNSLSFGQQNQVRGASIRTFFKLWQEQETNLPIYSKKSKSDPDFDSWAPPPSAIPPRGGGGFVSHESKNRAASFGCSYSRHPSDQGKDNKDLDILSIEGLIEERNDARKEHNFDRADAIRDALKNIHGVFLNDSERIWGTYASVTGYLGHSPRMPEQFGPTGHDYQLCDDAGPSISPLSDDKIHKLISERLQCKLNRDFARADEIKKELDTNDVSIDDSNKLWRSDGVRIYFAGGRNKKFEYTYAPDAGPSEADMTDEEVVKLLAERQDCRLNRDFEEADRIRDDLEGAGVQIDDVNRMWRADGNPFSSEPWDGSNTNEVLGDTQVYRGDKGKGLR